MYSWILSVENARKHFTELSLYTDDEGAALLVDDLLLPFTEVSTCLNDLRDQDPDWWMLGKLHAYRKQQSPFVHCDSDVYLWKPLPDRMRTAAVFAQNPEETDVPWYDADYCEQMIRRRGDGWIPAEWSGYRMRESLRQAACCGILGGTDVDFLRQYASLVIRILQSPRNRFAFNAMQDKKLYNPFFEQYLLCACATARGVPIEYLFDSINDAMDHAAEIGYTHLISDAKSNPTIAERLEARVARDFPESYERCNRLSLV
jgi:hypothetical protein